MTWKAPEGICGAENGQHAGGQDRNEKQDMEKKNEDGGMPAFDSRSLASDRL